MTCCYLVQSHSDSAQVLRLVRTIKRGSPGALVLVVHDGRTQELDPRPFRELADVEVIVRRDRVERGEWSVLSPLLAGLRELVGNAWPFDWLLYLSGQDYPVRPLASVEAGLAATKHHGFLSWWDALGPESPWRSRQGRTRYYAQYRRLPQWTMGPLKAARFL